MQLETFFNNYTGKWSIQQTINYLANNEIKKTNYNIQLIHSYLNDKNIIISCKNDHNSVDFKLEWRTFDLDSNNAIIGQIVKNNNQIGICKLEKEYHLKLYKKFKGLDIEENLKLLSNGLYISNTIIKLNGNLIATSFKSAIKLKN
uniref:hypothetical protein n=1 Tax=Porphyridium aerugineum TaxID=2792 RepID=UPI001FCD5CB9|nr:hypothetical protein MW505_pgp126 [Porphyridium aerugineum]UNJ17871.1 hypothetical protein [Porphyridium aerugineum]